MWMNHTVARVDPGNVDTAVELLDVPEVRTAFSKAPGFQALYVVANLDDLAEVISVTIWDSEAEGKAFYGNEEYKQIFGSVAHLVTAPPQHKSFEVRIDHTLQAEPA